MRVHSKPIKMAHPLGFLFNLWAAGLPLNHALEASAEGQNPQKKDMIF